MAIHVAVGTGCVHDILGWRDKSFNEAVRRATEALEGRAVRTFNTEDELASVTVFEVLEKFHQTLLQELSSDAQILATLRQEVEEVANNVYHRSQFRVENQHIFNLLAVHAVFPHGQENGYVEFLPDFALAPRFYGCFLLERLIGKPLEGRTVQGVKKVLRRWRDFFPKDVEKVECRLCDSLEDVDRQARLLKEELEDRVKAFPSTQEAAVKFHILPPSEESAKRYSEVWHEARVQNAKACFSGSDRTLTIHPIVEGFRETRALRRSHPEVPCVGTHRLLSATALRQGLAYPTLSGLFPTSLWKDFSPPIRHFLLEAAELVAQQSSPVGYPNIPTAEDMEQLRNAASDVEVGKGFDRGQHEIPLRRLGWFDWIDPAIPPGTFPQAQAVEPLSRGSAPWDWTGPIGEMCSALNSENIEQSLCLRNALDLYPLHKRVLGLVEYIIVPRLVSKGVGGNAPSALWSNAFIGWWDAGKKQPGLASASLSAQAGLLATLETEGNWLIHAKDFETGRGTGPIALANLLDGIVTLMSSAPEVSGLSVTLHPASTKEQAGQLATLADRSNNKAASMTLYLGKIALMLRNAIEHGTDQVRREGLLVASPGYWTEERYSKKQNKYVSVFPDWLTEVGAGTGWPSTSSRPSLPATLPMAANSLLLTPASLQRCLVLLSLVMHAGYSHLGI